MVWCNLFAENRQARVAIASLDVAENLIVGPILFDHINDPPGKAGNRHKTALCRKCCFFRLTQGVISGKVGSATNTTFSRFLPASRLATGGLCCFWGLLSRWLTKDGSANHRANSEACPRIDPQSRVCEQSQHLVSKAGDLWL